MASSILEFQEMNEGEYNRFIATQNEAYAREIARNFLRAIVEVRVEAQNQLRVLLPDGVRSKGHSFLNVVEKKSASTVGAVWFKLEEGSDRAFLYYIEILAPHRGKGFGKEAMNLLKDLLKKQNVKALGLHVFADNQVAINLYKKQGFTVRSYNMQKNL